MNTMLQALRLETCFTDASNHWPEICSIEPTRRTSLGCSPRRLRMVKPIVETKRCRRVFRMRLSAALTVAGIERFFLFTVSATLFLKALDGEVPPSALRSKDFLAARGQSSRLAKSALALARGAPVNSWRPVVSFEERSLARATRAFGDRGGMKCGYERASADKGECDKGQNPEGLQHDPSPLMAAQKLRAVVGLRSACRTPSGRFRISAESIWRSSSA
jgi:hypothetical protein